MAVQKVDTADGVTVVAEEAGRPDGPAVLLVGGTTQPRGFWGLVAGGLADQYRVITYDSRDVGESDRCPDGYGTVVLADDAARVLDAFNIDRAHVAGLSLGGCVALQLAVRHPDRVASASTASCWTRADTHLRSQFQFWIDLVDTAGFGMLFRLMGYMSFSPETQEQMGDISAIAAAVEGATDVDAFRRQVEADLTHALSDEELGSISAPLLVLWGTDDLLVPKRYAEALAATVPGAEIAPVDGVSHSMVLDKPDRYAAALRGWFDRQPVS